MMMMMMIMMMMLTTTMMMNICSVSLIFLYLVFKLYTQSGIPKEKSNVKTSKTMFCFKRSRHQTMVCSSLLTMSLLTVSGAWWRIGWVDSFQPEGHGFDSCSSRHVGALGKSLSHSCLWRLGMKLRHRIRAVSGTLLSRSGLEEAL